MKGTSTRQIRAMVALNKEPIAFSGVPVFLAADKKEQEKIASELGRTLNGNIYGLCNGIIIITEE